MPYEHDVFISYSHLGNQDDGWVAKFHSDLETRLDNYLGRKSQVCRDNKLKFASNFGNEIRDLLRKSKVLLCVLSPGYIQSDWCRRELREFHSFAQRSGGLSVNNMSRIMTVMKTLVPEEKHPKEMQGSLYNEFFYLSGSGAPLMLGQNPGDKGYEDYDQKVGEVAWSIKEVVEAMGEGGQADVERTIYLAETTRDRMDDRDKIKAELEARDFIVLPEEKLPYDDVQIYKEAVSECLQRCFMSIHLMGSSYGLRPAGTDYSIIRLQNEWAAEHSEQQKQFKRLIWIPPKLENPEDKQSEFLEELRNSEAAQRGAQLHERSLEELKTRIIQLITKPPTPPTQAQGIKVRRIYVMCDRPDNDLLKPVCEYLYDQKIKDEEGKAIEYRLEVIPPAEEDEEGQVIQYHKESLLFCDATLIIYGKTKWNWVQFRLNDVIERTKGWGRESDISCKAILIADPKTDQKDIVKVHTAKCLTPSYEAESLEAPLNEFVDYLAQALSA